MKKNYFKPEVEMIDLAFTGMIAASVVVGGDDEDAGVNKHRGEWGNVWGK